MSRRTKQLLGLGVLAAAVAFVCARVPLVSAQELEKQLAAFFHRPAHVGAVRYRLLPFEVEVLDVRIGGLRPESPPFLTVSRVVASPSLRQLWEGRIVLTHLRVESPTIRVNAFANGGDDIPPLGGSEKSRELRVRRLVIAGGELILDHQRVPLDLDLPAFRGRLAQRRQGILAGSIGFGPGVARFGQAAPLPLTLDADIAWSDGTLNVESSQLITEGAALRGRGQVRVRPRLAADLAVEGPVDLAVLDRSVLQSGFALQGAASYQGTVQLVGARLRLRGRVTGTAGRFQGVEVPRFQGQASWDEKGLRLEGLDASLLGGQARFDVEVPPPGRGPAHVVASLSGVDAERTAAAVFAIGTPGVGARASGEVDVSWPRGRMRELSGQAALDLSPLEDGRTPLSGRVVWSARAGEQRLEEVKVRTPITDAQLAGTLARSGDVDLALDASSRDLQATEALVQRLRMALGARPAEPLGFEGVGAFHGRWRGTLEAPVFEGRFAGEEVTYLGVRWGRAEWAGTATVDEVRSHSLVLKRPGGELWMDGRLDTGVLGERDAVDVRLRLENWPAADLLTALAWDLELEGPLSGTVVVSGRRSAPQGQASLKSPAGRYYGVPFDALAVATQFSPGLTTVTRGTAKVGGGALAFHGGVTDTGLYDGAAELTDLDVGALFPRVPQNLRPGGRLSGTVVVAGPLARPRVDGTLRSRRLFLGDEGVGALEARLLGKGDGQVTVEARARSPRVDLQVAGQVGATAPFPAALRFALSDTSVDPFVRAAYPRLPSTVGVVTSGTLSLDGPLQRPEELHAVAEARHLQVLLPDYPVKNREPLRVELAGGRLTVRDLHLFGEGTDLAVTGSAAVLAEGELALSVKGAADLRALSVVTRELRGRGAARVALALSGTRSAPVVDGTLDIDGAGVRVRGFPHGVEDVHGQVRFDGRAAHFANVTGTIGGGPVELEGQAAYGGGRLGSFDVRGTGRALTLRYPEGLRSVVDADLRFFGDTREQWLTGDVTVRQAVWNRRYDVASELLAPAGPLTDDVSLGGGVRYDVRISAPGTIKVDNNLATLQARADLRLAGNYAAPVVLGRAELERGRVYFQGNTYAIRRGSLDFANPQKVDPLFDIEAETRVRSYGVTLKVNGTLERVYPTLTSDPPLSTVQILALLAGQDERDVVSLAQVQTDQSRLAAVGAASLAAGRLSEEVGLERGAARLGLSRFSIDPAVVRGQTNPTARLTVGKRITPDLNIVYSQDVKGIEERLFSVEYTLSDRLSVVLTRSEEDGVGFDLRVRRTR
jgi:autotransporter translocation and assembly factor TamB